MIALYIAVGAFIAAGLLIWDWVLLTVQLAVFKKGYTWLSLVALFIDWLVIGIAIWKYVTWIW